MKPYELTLICLALAVVLVTTVRLTLTVRKHLRASAQPTAKAIKVEATR